MDLAIEGNTIYPIPAEANVNKALMVKEASPKKGGISCEYMAAKVAKVNAKIRRNIILVRTKMNPSAGEKINPDKPLLYIYCQNPG